MTLRSHSERLMGTTITISLVDEQADIFLQKSFDLLKELEYRFNANSQESELMEINYQAGIAPVTVHPDLFELISLGLEHSLALSSHLNISIGPLIQTWQIGIQDPANPRGNHLMTIPVVNKSVVTSGIYERHLTVDGQDYHHIFDSQTGYPVETELASLTIISDKSVDGEIWTTRLFGERPASILWQVESLEGIEVILIDKEGHLSCSSGIPTL